MSYLLICGKINSMREIIEKNAILIASLITFLISYANDGNHLTLSVYVFLVAVILTETGIYLKETKGSLVVLAIFVVLCLSRESFVFFIPVAISFLVEAGVYYGLALSILYIPLAWDISIEILFMQLILCMLSGMLSYGSRQISVYRKRYTETKDSSTELENKLRQKNKDLLESQDTSVFVATLKERNRIAREIHDNVGHMLSRTILQTGALMTIYKEEPLHGQLQSINASLNEAMNSIRESVHDLHDESVDLKLSALDVLKPLKNNYEIDFDYDMPGNVEGKVKYCFTSIIKEATSNIVKHSSATRIYVLLREHPGFYQLVVEDNGKEKIDVLHAGIGLTNMKDRVAALEGSITFSDTNGFKIMVSVPKRNREQGE